MNDESNFSDLVFQLPTDAWIEIFGYFDVFERLKLIKSATFFETSCTILISNIFRHQTN